MPLVKNGEQIEESFLALADDAVLPADGDVIISLGRLESEFDTLAAHPGQLGVDLPNDADVSVLEPYLHRLELIALSLPAMGDGRAFSQARLLRQILRFKGEIRARGKLVPDQIAFLRQVGVDAFELSDRFNLDAVLNSATAMSLTYQQGYQPGHGFSPRDVFRSRAGRTVGLTANEHELRGPGREQTP